MVWTPHALWIIDKLFHTPCSISEKSYIFTFQVQFCSALLLVYVCLWRKYVSFPLPQSTVRYSSILRLFSLFFKKKTETFKNDYILIILVRWKLCVDWFYLQHLNSIKILTQWRKRLFLFFYIYLYTSWDFVPTYFPPRVS